MSRVPSLLVVFALAPGAVACGSSSGDTFTARPTLVAVSAEDFRGAVPCAPALGAMRTFVATLTDIGTSDAPLSFTLPSSVVASSGGYLPIPCQQAAAFAFVVPGHRYVAEIDAYDRSDLRALGPGSRYLVEQGSGAYAPPRWTTRCGQGLGTEGPVTAVQYRTRYLRGCEPLADAVGSETLIRIETSSLLGALTCGAGTGEVELFEGRLLEPSSELSSVQSAACGDALVFGALQGGRIYDFEVFAFQSGQPAPTWGTACTRQAESGALVEAACGPLSAAGSIELDTSAVAAVLGTSCGPGGLLSVSADIVATGAPKTVPCGALIRFSELEPRGYALSVTTTTAAGPGAAAMCEVQVEPGVVRRATCVGS
ncbi:MAG: hypothetical protein KF718_22475 [Polyangiaceae bacterium]|nr:hypothetical protein [Polyangiaceae bacterium]